jgi:hypothetical protein
MTKKVLMVGDHNDSREILTLMITRIGYHAITARNSKEAIACAEADNQRSSLWMSGYQIVTESTRVQFLDRIEKPLTFLSSRLRHGCPNYGGKCFESGHRNISTKTGFTSDAKTDDRGIYCESLTRGDALVFSSYTV